jgi:hypothetical protein
VAGFYQTLQLMKVMIAVVAAALASGQVSAKEVVEDKIFGEGDNALQQELAARKMKFRQTIAISKARQIGLALFEFDVEYGEYPNQETVADVKGISEAKVEIKAATANDCFFQLIAAKILPDDSLFALEDPAAPEPGGDRKPCDKVDESFFSYIAHGNSSGHPERPLVVAPLVAGERIFDRDILGGKAVVLFNDCSVRLFPIEADGRVLIEGKDLFDPEQPFWQGKIPPVKWPEP